MTMVARRIQVTLDDMVRLRDLIRVGRRSTRRDKNHLAELNRELDRAEVVAAAADIRPNVVTMNSVVRVRDLDTNARVVYRLVFPSDADIEHRRISVLAPIGTALIGYRVGDRVAWTTPGGTRRFEVEEVLYQPETAAA